MQQGKLNFQRITADEAAQQRERIAQAHATEHPPRPPQPLPERRAPGRPRLKRPLELAAIESSNTEPTGSSAAAETEQDNKRSYTSWFSSPYINDVLSAYSRAGNSAKAAVARLKRQAPDDRYARLSDSTVRSWFDPNNRGQLLPRFQAQLEAETAAARGGRPSVLSTAVEEEIKRVLLQMRSTGASLSSHVIRWVMQAVFRERDPALLDRLQLSRQWISQWVRSQLDWRWRARTTAASKLPLDWQQQGVLMAKRIAAKMEMHKVSKCPSLRIGRLNQFFLGTHTDCGRVAVCALCVSVHRCIPLSL